MIDPRRLMFLHGLFGSSQGYKATLLRQLFPGIHTPDFSGSLEERMAQLEPLLGEETGWTLIGSSFGGLMAALYTARHPSRVRQLILLAPALVWPDFASQPPAPVAVPTVIYHGRQDELIPVDTVRALAQQVFETLTFHEMDDNHSLHNTVEAIDWVALLGS